MRGIKTKADHRWKQVAIFSALFLVCLFALNGLYNIYQKKEEAEKILARTNTEAANLIERKKNLTDTLERLQTTEGLKYEMRKQLNVAEVGESVAFIVEEETTAGPTPLQKSAWQELKEALKNLFK